MAVVQAAVCRVHAKCLQRRGACNPRAKDGSPWDWIQSLLRCAGILGTLQEKARDGKGAWLGGEGKDTVGERTNGALKSALRTSTFKTSGK